MDIHGLQKMTLLDFPGHVACTIFLGGCDFACPFCHNFELIDGTAKPLLTDVDLLEFLGKRKGLLDGVAITGGEPCLHKDLPDLLKKIRAMGFKTKLDTNGYHPQLLKQILDEKLVDYVAMDIKNSEEKYNTTCGKTYIDLNLIKQSISYIMNSGIDYEFRTTVVSEFHEANDFHSIGQLIQSAQKYYLQSFTDRDTVPFENLHAPSKEQLIEYANIAKKYINNVYIRGVE